MFAHTKFPDKEGTQQVKDTKRLPRIEVSADGDGVVSHAGSRLLSELAEELGLTDALSKAMSPTRKRRSGHDRGKVLVDLAVMLADGGGSMSDLAVLRNQAELFGKVASDPTAWRVVDSIDSDRLAAIEKARADIRARAWSAGAKPDWIVLDLDATLVDSHSEKENAAPTYKRGFGFHPMVCYLDSTDEALAGVLREGNAGSNTAKDQIEVIDKALAQLPVKTKAEDEKRGSPMLVRADSASCSHEFTDAVRERGLEFSIGYPLNEEVAKAVVSLPHKAWRPCTTQDVTELREGAECAEITHLLDLCSWPVGSRMICRREDPHPGAQLTFTDFDGHRFQCFITDSDDKDLAYLEARHRGHARVEDRIRGAKDTGLGNLPFHDFMSNQVWLTLVMIAQDLVAWSQMLLLDDEFLNAEPKRLRYALWHCAGRLVRSGRRSYLRLQKNWPWAEDLARAFDRLRALPLRA